MRYLIGIFVAVMLASSPMLVSAQQPGDSAQYPKASPTTSVPQVTPGATVIQTTAPVETSISLGTWAGEVLKWVAALFVATIGTVATLWIKRLFDWAGIKVSQAQSDELDRALVNGLNASAEGAAQAMAGRGKIEVKDAIVRGAIDYALTHKEQLLKSMGADSGDAATIAALKARIATLAADPMKPTPPILTPPDTAAVGAKA